MTMVATVASVRLGSIPAGFGRKCVRRAAAGARALHLQAAARRRDRMLHADRAGESRAARGPRGAPEGGGAEGQAHRRRRSRWSISRAAPAMRRWWRRAPAPMPLAEGDWWNETAVIRRRRDVIIMSQRGAGGADAQPRLLRSAHLRARQGPAPRRDRAAGARHPGALPRRPRQAQDRSLDVHDAGAGRRRRRPRDAPCRSRKINSTASPTARAGGSR